MKVLCVFGTRPEAIKMAPLVNALAAEKSLQSKVCVTGQHRGMLDQVLDVFKIKPDFDLDIMTRSQTLEQVVSRVLEGMGAVFTQWRPDYIIVQGDTTTTFAASLAAYYARISIAHVEAGLRTGDKYAPWPEEMNRRMTTALADIHFAPTSRARANLVREGVDPDKIHLTGNTIIDALLYSRNYIDGDEGLKADMGASFPFLENDRKLVLVTSHRRENFGESFENICRALVRIGETGKANVVFPAHRNPRVREPVERHLGNRARIHLLEPQNYLPFIYLMTRAHIILTDSGGIQEEAPSLGKPVLVMREKTERCEAVEAGVAKLVGTDQDHIYNQVMELIEDEAKYASMSQAINPYGDGQAASRIVEILKHVGSQVDGNGV